MAVPQWEPIVLMATAGSCQHEGKMAAAPALHHRLAEMAACHVALHLSDNQW